MWLETDRTLNDRIVSLRNADKLLAWGNLLYRGDESTARDLDLATECFIRAAEYKKTEAIHRIYFINKANEAVAEDKPRIEQILAKTNLYKCTVGMLSAQIAKDLHELILNDSVNSKEWQHGFEQLNFAAQRKDVFAKFELALHYMVGRGCKQDCELAEKYANEAYKAYPLFSFFIQEYRFSQKIPSLSEVLYNPNWLSVPTFEEFLKYSTPFYRPLPIYRRIPSSFMVFYPELIIKGLRSPSAVQSQQYFTAVWPEFYQLFNWEKYNRYPWHLRRIPYLLLMHRPQFAELIPINWAKAKKDDIFLVNKHQKFERYIKPEQFSPDDFRKILRYRPEYAEFANIHELSSYGLLNIAPLQDEERNMLNTLGYLPYNAERKIRRWIKFVEKSCGIQNQFQNNDLHEEIEEMFLSFVEKERTLSLDPFTVE